VNVPPTSTPRIATPLLCIAVAIRAFLFDFDGLILDTETASRAGWRWLYEQHGQTLPDDLWITVVGTHGSWDIWGHLEELIGEPLDRDVWNERRYAHELTLLEAEELRPGILDYLAYAREHELKRAIVSSASRRWIDMHLERLEQTVGWDAIITADRDAARAKPNPTMYLEALETLGVGAREAVVFEDSLNGVRAARAAGIFVVGVPNEVTRAFGLEGADLVVDSLAELPPAELVQRADARGRETAREHDDPVGRT
jgi:putative hydrolase of the HAD superfamily